MTYRFHLAIVFCLVSKDLTVFTIRIQNVGEMNEVRYHDVNIIQTQGGRVRA